MSKILTGIIPDAWDEMIEDKRDFIEVTACCDVKVTDKNRERFKETLQHIKASLAEEFGPNMIEASISMYPRPWVRVMLRKEKRK